MQTKKSFLIALCLHGLLFIGYFFSTDSNQLNNQVYVKNANRKSFELNSFKTSSSNPQQISGSKKNLQKNTESSNQSINSNEVNSEAASLVPNNFDGSILSFSNPNYPIIARKRGFEGQVLLKIMVDGESGAVDSTEILRSSGHPELDKAALQGAKSWTFKTHSDNYILEKTIVFKLNSKPN